MYFYYPSERDQTIDLTGELLKNVGAYSQEEEKQHTQPRGRKATDTVSRKEDNTMKKQPMDETKYIWKRANILSI